MVGRRARSTQGLSLAIAGIGMLAGLVLLPATASAGGPANQPVSAAVPAMHLKLVKADPAVDSTVAAPQTIRLWFSEAVVLKATSVKIVDASGAAVSLSPLSRGKDAKAPVVAKVLSKLAPGHYTVTWRAMGDDSHVVTGHYGFTIAADADKVAAAAPAKPAPAKPTSAKSAAPKPAAKP